MADTTQDGDAHGHVRRAVRAAALIACGVQAASGLARAQIDVLAVAVSESQAPGTGGALYITLGTPVINTYGVLAFKAGLSTGGECVMVGSSQTLSPAARTGEAPPSIPLSQFSVFDQPLISDAGAVAFTASIVGGDATFESNRVAVGGPPGALALVARTGDSAPGTFSGEAFYGFDTLRMGGSGHIALLATLSGEFVDSTNNTGVWSGTALAPLALAARGGDLVGSAIPGTLYTSIGVPSINAQGQVALTGIIAGSGVGTTNDQVTFRGVPGALAVALREGAQAADAPAGVRYAALGSPALNGAGRVALSGNLRGAGVTVFNDTAAWTDADGAWSQVVRAGDPATGVPNANISIPGSVRLNARGRVVLLSALTGAGITPANDLALWTDVPGTLTLIAQKGRPAPQAEPGVTIGAFGPAAINAQGLVVFRVTLAGPGVSAANNAAIYVWDVLGTRLVARTGSAMTLDGVPRTISALAVALDSGLQDGRPCSFGERGLLAFRAASSDGFETVALGALSRCMADIVGVGDEGVPDGQYTLDDVLAFVNAWADSDLIGDLADVGGRPFPDGQLTLDDILLFTNAYNDGCPY